jgi:hypothetical protein
MLFSHLLVNVCRAHGLFSSCFDWVKIRVWHVSRLFASSNYVVQLLIHVVLCVSNRFQAKPFFEMPLLLLADPAVNDFSV